VAANALLKLFTTNGVYNIVPTIQVEIYNQEEMYCDYSLPLPDHPALLAALQQVSEPISKAVCRTLGSAWSSIAYHMRANKVKENLSHKPTVIVFCHPGSTCNFEFAEEQIRKILDTVPMEIYLEILSGKIRLATPKLDKKSLMLWENPKKPSNGASISIRGRTDEAGTLGGWVTLNLPKQMPVKCALTCYHVIRPRDRSIAEHTDEMGIRLNNALGKVVVEYPAAYDAIPSLKALDRYLEKNPGTTDLIKARGNLSSHMLNPDIGCVILASGHARTEENNRLDWALIESPETFSTNRPSSRTALMGYYKLDPSVPYDLDEDSKITSFGQLQLGEWVFKVGRTTDHTSGFVNYMRRLVQWEAHVCSYETEVMHYAADFAGPGDSGSMVTNTKGELVGLLFGIDKEASCFNIGIVTPIQKIQQHIKEMTGGGFLSLE
jgi:hypothetical protein